MPKLKRCRSKLCLLLGGDLNNSNRIGSAIDGDISKADQGNSAINCFIINIHIDDFAILNDRKCINATVQRVVQLLSYFTFGAKPTMY